MTVACWCEKRRLRLNFVDNLCFDKRFVVSLTIGFWWEFFFNSHDHWPWLWPWRELALALASNMLSSNPSLVVSCGVLRCPVVFRHTDLYKWAIIVPSGKLFVFIPQTTPVKGIGLLLTHCFNAVDTHKEAWTVTFATRNPFPIPAAFCSICSLCMQIL